MRESAVLAAALLSVLAATFAEAAGQPVLDVAAASSLAVAGSDERAENGTAVVTGLFGACPRPHLPRVYDVGEETWTWVMELSVFAGSVTFGTIKATPFSVHQAMTMYDAGGNVLVKGQREILTFQNVFDLFDCQGNLLATFEESFYSSSKVYTKYEILDGARNIVGTSRKVESWATTFDIYDNVGTHLVTFSKPWASWSDQWHVQVANNTRAGTSLAADPRIVSMIAGFKTGRKNSGLGRKSLVLIGGVIIVLVASVAGFIFWRRQRSRARSGYLSINN